MTEEWIYERTGIRSRRIAGDDETTSSLATLAGLDALGSHGGRARRARSRDRCHRYRRSDTPRGGPLVQAGLGATRAGAFDVGAGCAGFLYALSVASALVDSGTVRRILICGADVLSQVAPVQRRA